MGILGRKGIETIDYTLLQKRGFIKKTEIPDKGFKVDSKGMIDFTSSAGASPTENSSAGTQNNESPFAFFDNIAQSSGFEAGSSTQNDNPDINAFKIKIEDLEYKLANLIDKLSLIESKLENFERKVV